MLMITLERVMMHFKRVTRSIGEEECSVMITVDAASFLTQFKMYSVQSSPYFLKFPPYDLTRALELLEILSYGSGLPVGVALVVFFRIEGVSAGIVCFISVIMPGILLILNFWVLDLSIDISKKWCYVPPFSQQSQGIIKAWVQKRGETYITIEEPGFYFLKPGYQSVFVGTTEEFEYAASNYYL